MNWDAALNTLLRIVAVLVLVFLNGFFVAAEFAMVKIRDTQLTPLIHRGHRRAKVAEFILNRLEAFLSAAQLGITLASLGLGWIGEPVFSALLQPVFGWFERQHPDVDLQFQFVPFGQYEQKMATALVGNSPPDVFQSSVYWAEGFYDRGMLPKAVAYGAMDRLSAALVSPDFLSLRVAAQPVLAEITKPRRRRGRR